MNHHTQLGKSEREDGVDRIQRSVIQLTICFSAKHFRVTQLLKIPTLEEIGPGYLPSYSYPSDHVSLVADFKLADVTPV
uniref:Endonuclease/exonuclease/phosphatase domain-containing protein n=1 Tax=Arion vulgaris TaxID=1028688 RepID=A0A0B6Z6Q4_9EUPU